MKDSITVTIPIERYNELLKTEQVFLDPENHIIQEHKFYDGRIIKYIKTKDDFILELDKKFRSQGKLMNDVQNQNHLMSLEQDQLRLKLESTIDQLLSREHLIEQMQKFIDSHVPNVTNKFLKMSLWQFRKWKRKEMRSGLSKKTFDYWIEAIFSNARRA